MKFLENAKHCFGNAFNLSGRASRPEFWRFVLFLFLGFCVCTLLNSLIFGPELEYGLKVTRKADGTVEQGLTPKKMYSGGRIATVFALICLLPLLAVGARRLHDTGRATWWGGALVCLPYALVFLISRQTSQIALAPELREQNPNLPATVSMPNIEPATFFAMWLFGAGCIITLIVFLARKSQPSANKYGPNPHEVPQ